MDDSSQSRWGGAVRISTVCVPGNGRGATRTKTGNQTGDCPPGDFPEIKAFKVLRRLISAAFFQRKSKKRGGNGGKRRQQPGRRKAGGGAQAHKRELKQIIKKITITRSFRVK